MRADRLKAMIRSAIRGGVIGGLAAAGCGTALDAGPIGQAGSTGSALPNTPAAGRLAVDPAQPTNVGTGGTMSTMSRPPVAGVAVATAGAVWPVAGNTGMVTGGIGSLPSNCQSSPVGTCCSKEVCFTFAGVEELFGRALGSGGPDLDADAGTLDTCPAHGPQTGICTFYGELISAGEDRCCYIETSGSCCGRPLLVGERALGATVRVRGDWAQALAPLAADMDALTRTELARAWLTDARLEHASIASFARFTLQALALGAPADLIADTQRAALDEIEHAQLCFALASRYAGRAIGPGEFPMEGVLASATLAEAAAATVREGCVAETVAALQAQAQLLRAGDPEVRAALSRISEDEGRHAELAWRFVRWAVDAGGAPVRSAVAQAFDEALGQLRAEPASGVNAANPVLWQQHGRLTPAEERTVRDVAAREVIEPSARELIGIALV